MEYTARTGNRNVLYSLTINPAGFPAMKKVHLMLESYQKLKAELQGSETRLGVLYQAVLGHGVRNFPPTHPTAAAGANAPKPNRPTRDGSTP